MNLLAFDTSTDHLSIAVQRGAQRWQYSGPGGAQSSATLIPAILALLAQADVARTDIHTIVFGRGPGSFTGLRTACAIAQGWALGIGCPVLPVDTLVAVAEHARMRYGCTAVLATLDARMNEVYHGVYRWRQGRWHSDGPIGLCAPHAVVVPPDCVVVGNAYAVYGQRLAAHNPCCTHHHALPTAYALLHIAQSMLAQGAVGVPAHEALPVYVRDKVAQTTAERQAQARSAL